MPQSGNGLQPVALATGLNSHKFFGPEGAMLDGCTPASFAIVAEGYGGRARVQSKIYLFPVG